MEPVVPSSASNKLKDFHDLEWNGARARAFFVNGYGVSVVTLSELRNILYHPDYTNPSLIPNNDGREEWFEMVILVGDETNARITYDAPLASEDDYPFTLTLSEVNKKMAEVQALPKPEPVP
jgi:hypothetical protein